MPALQPQGLRLQLLKELTLADNTTYRLGVDYYPEHWDETRWATDARLMREVGLDTVRVAEFSWAKIEPSPGVYDFAWLDRACETLADAGLKIILGTPTATPPAWLVTAESSILPVNKLGQRLSFGGRRHYCASSQVYREYSENIVRRMAAHFQNHPNIIGWQIDNELGNHDTSRCYCDDCRTGFHKWLQRKYKTLDGLNQAWGTVFWSQTYTDWAQIPVPLPAPTVHNPALLLDFYRFSSANTVDFLEIQIGWLREYFSPDRYFITHNAIPLDDFMDLPDLAKKLDFMAWDNYPHGGHGMPHVAFNHALMYGLLNRPAWVMEQQIGNINWTAYNPAVPPGQARLWTHYNRAHGAGGTVYFRWRECLFGQEQYHSAFLRHDASPGRFFAELQQAHAETRKLPTDYGVRPVAPVALLFSYDDLWTFQIEPHNAAFDYAALARDLYAGLQERNIACDILPRGTSPEVLARYKLVIAPAPALVNRAEFANWQQYVENGGNLLLTFRAATKEPSNIWTPETLPGALSEFAGVTVEDWLSYPPPDVQGDGRWGWSPVTDKPILVESQDGRLFEARRLWAELLATTPETEIIARYSQADEDDFFAGRPALTRRKRGAGTISYLASWPQHALHRYLWSELFADAAPPADNRLPVIPGVEIVASGAQSQFVTIFNHTKQPVKLSLPPDYAFLLPTLNAVEIEPRGVWFCQRPI
jgi:beta-galactosidase